MLKNTFSSKIPALVLSLFLFSLFPVFAFADHCSVSQISIIPGPWENTASKTSLTVQSQSPDSEFCHVNQTLRLSFSSTGTGLFTGQTGSSVQAWVSTNSANRNFYYDPSSSGDVITIQAGYGTADSWEKSFSATYTIPGVSNSIDDESSIVSSQTTETESSVVPKPPKSDSSRGVSAHYGATPLSNLSSSINFEVSSGRDRLAMSGTPIEFKTDIAKSYLGKTHVEWNFGDGNVAYGFNTSHSYMYPGHYIVVVNVDSPEGKAVSRSRVDIISPDISIAHASPERVEVFNSSNSEVNLFGRALISGERSFIFPRDTILAPKQKISFAASTTGLSPQNYLGVSLIVVGENIKPADLILKVESERLRQINVLREEVANLENKKLALLTSSQAEKNMFLGETFPAANQTEFSNNDINIAGDTALVLGTSLEVESSNRISVWLRMLKEFFLRRQ